MRIPRKRSNRQPKINTTSLPDIIFMLLFFFMVTTTIQNDNLDYVELPSAASYEARPATLPNEVHIYLGKEANREIIKIDGQEYPNTSIEQQIGTALADIKQQGRWIDRAILWIGQDTPMSTVNAIKTGLQHKNILQVSYIHNQASTS